MSREGSMGGYCRCNLGRFGEVSCLLKCPVLRNSFLLLAVLGPISLFSQQQPAQPKVKVNMLNVCTPSPEEQQEISTALGRVPKQPLFSPEFEVDRGRSLLTEPAGFLQPAGSVVAGPTDPEIANWVRIRREFSVQALFSTVQYSFSQDAKNMMETLVFRVREPKDLLQLSIEDSVSAVTAPESMLSTSTPAGRIKLERFGKSSIVLAHCLGSEGNPPPDQSAYTPLFQAATGIVSNYRRLLQAQTTIPEELARVSAVADAAAKSSRTAAKKSTKKTEPKK
jgi:hypothetical protein